MPKNETGIYAGVKTSIFTTEELQIIKIFAAKYWKVTRAEQVALSNSNYKLMLIKPTEAITHSFNLQREVVVVFSPYETFQPRSIEAIDYLSVGALRVEEICCILICKDVDVENSISQLIKSNQEARVIVPFSYTELLENASDAEFVNNKIRQHFYSRDLFSIQDPLKKDFYFFGRKDIIQELVNKHLNNENAGLFGLRKTGKTSILYGVERALDRKRSMSVIIDCQTLHLKPWNLALFAVIDQLFKKSHDVKLDMLHTAEEYTNESFVSDYFEEDIRTISRKNRKKILLIFDEIEHITFGTSGSEGWRSGNYFRNFWQVLRSAYQRNSKGEFSFLVTGTNPHCVEQPSINNVDNPIFMQFAPLYIPAFTFEQTQEMVNKLGGYMGVTFDASVCTALVDDFGGHPLLIRQMCSYIHLHINDSRPQQVLKFGYEEYRDTYYRTESIFEKYADMVLKVLRDWYPDEYHMLEWLSVGDEQTFNGLAALSTTYVDHLKKYEIVGEYKGKYYFKNEALKHYLSQRNRYKKLHLTNEERQQEISERRNSVEPKLRRIVSMTLKLFNGVDQAKRKVLSEIYGTSKINKYMNQEYAELFDPYKNKIMLSHLFSLIRKNWDNGFKNIFGGNIDLFNAHTTIINFNRKPDAHAANVTETDFNTFRGSMSWLEERVAEYDK